MKRIGSGLMMSAIRFELLRGIHNATLRECPDGNLWIFHQDGRRIGVVIELELARSDYDRREELFIDKFKKSSSRKIKSGFTNPENLPVYSFLIKESAD